MPAPAVIPALIAYIKVAAVKTLVVGTQSGQYLSGSRPSGNGCGGWGLRGFLTVMVRLDSRQIVYTQGRPSNRSCFVFTMSKLKRSKQTIMVSGYSSME